MNKVIHVGKWNIWAPDLKDPSFKSWGLSRNSWGWLDVLFDSEETAVYAMENDVDLDEMEEKQAWLRDNEPLVERRHLTLAMVKEIEAL